MKNTFLLLLFPFVAFQYSFPNGENTADKKIVAVRTNVQIVIDGLLTEHIWKRPGYEELKQQDPDQGLRPSQRSEFWVAYDDEAIYFAAKYYDNNPDSIMARLVRRDFIWVILQTDAFYILILTGIKEADIFSMFLQQVHLQMA